MVECLFIRDVGSIIKVGAHRLRGTLAGLLGVGARGMLPCEILKLRSSEIPGNANFSLPAKCFQGGQPSYTKMGTLLESLKSGGHVPPVPPVPTSMFYVRFSYNTQFQT